MTLSDLVTTTKNLVKTKNLNKTTLLKLEKIYNKYCDAVSSSYKHDEEIEDLFNQLTIE